MSGTPTKFEYLYNPRDPRTLYLSKHRERPLSSKESWKSRSRYWNKLAKNAWKVETNQKGRILHIPTELAKLPIWVEWDQDVWDWRNHKLGGKDPYVRLHTSR